MSKKILPIFQVDAFTDEVFKGNPAAVVPLDNWLPDEQLQAIAAENNLAETAFYLRKTDHFELRWFTPGLEIDLCGHATLATAHVLYEHQGYKGDHIHFESLSGTLMVKKRKSDLQLDFPARPPEEVDPPEALLKGLDIEPLKVLKSRDYVAVYANETAIRAIKPNHAELEKLDCIGIAVTADGDHSDFVSRFFAPAAGVPEDPVTGSAHCSLVPYWADELQKDNLKAIQVSERSGTLKCRYDREQERVFLAGNCVTYLKGFIEI